MWIKQPHFSWSSVHWWMQDSERAPESDDVRHFSCTDSLGKLDSAAGCLPHWELCVITGCHSLVRAAARCWHTGMVVKRHHKAGKPCRLAGTRSHYNKQRLELLKLLRFICFSIQSKQQILVVSTDSDQSLLCVYKTRYRSSRLEFPSVF